MVNTIKILMDRINNIIINSKGCREWQCLDTSGYGQVSLNNKTIRVHRFVFEQLKGKIPDGLFVLHSCDNRKCCSIEHLHLGTNQDNMDVVARNRSSHKHVNKGELNGGHKLSKIDVLEIRAIYKTGEYSQKDIGETFGVSQGQIYRIVNYQRWKEF